METMLSGSICAKELFCSYVQIGVINFCWVKFARDNPGAKIISVAKINSISLCFHFRCIVENQTNEPMGKTGKENKCESLVTIVADINWQDVDDCNICVTSFLSPWERSDKDFAVRSQRRSFVARRVACTRNKGESSAQSSAEYHQLYQLQGRGCMWRIKEEYITRL